MDLVVRTVRFPLPGETILGAEFSTFPGGKGANQAVAIGKLGGNPLFVGKLGQDSFALDLQKSLVDAGVDCSALLFEPGLNTGIAVIMVEASGENMIVVASGANMELTAAEVEKALSSSPGNVLLAQLEVPLEAVMAAALTHQGIFVLNPAPARELPPELLARVDVLTPNENETQVLTGLAPTDPHSCREAAESLLQQGVKNVVITLGSAGCYMLGQEGEAWFDAFGVDGVDTTAAGDAFSGALAHSLSQCSSLREAIHFASAVAALSTTRPGAQASMPSKVEVEAFLAATV